MAETVQLPEDIQRRLNVLKAVGALGLCAIYGWFAILKDTQVPILEFLDIAVHEVGHKLFSPFGNLIMLIMGTGTQILFPFLVGIVFAIWKRDTIAWGICWAWSANAMCDGARYIYDAPVATSCCSEALTASVTGPRSWAPSTSTSSTSPIVCLPTFEPWASSRGSLQWVSSCTPWCATFRGIDDRRPRRRRV